MGHSQVERKSFGSGMLAQLQHKTRLLSGIAVLLPLMFLLAGCQLVQGGSWQSLRAEQGGAVISLATDPFNSHLLYVGTDNGYVYYMRSDKSSSLIPGSGLPHGAAIVSLLADPSKKGLVYAGTSSGFYVSTNASATWTPRGRGLPADDEVAVLAATDQDVLVAGSLGNGIYISSDQGNTWRAASNGLPAAADITSLLWEPTTKILYAAVDSVGVFASSDHGATWNQRSIGLPKNVDALAVLPSKGINANGVTIYAGTDHGVYASTDGGTSWAIAGTGLSQPVYSLSTYAGIPGWIYAGTATDALRSIDGGRTWKTVAPGLSQKVIAIASIPSSTSIYITFVAAQNLWQFPPPSGSGGFNFLTLLTNGLVLLGLLAALFYFTRRMRISSSRPAPQSATADTDGASTNSANAPASVASAPKKQAKMSPQVRNFTDQMARQAQQQTAATQAEQERKLPGNSSNGKSAIGTNRAEKVDRNSFDTRNGHNGHNGRNGHSGKNGNSGRKK